MLRRRPRCALAASFNDWALDKTPLKRTKNGRWTAQLMLAPGAYEYRFRVDGEWVDDPAAEGRVPNPFGTSNCVRQV
jgi:1,4-alpha-glucan branching enzyme